jgi:hypothetical protein
MSTPGAPGTSSGQGSLKERWAADGVTGHPLPEDTAQVFMRGGQTLAAPNPGDDIELFTDVDGKQGRWQGGFTALSDMRQGEMGGPYDGQDVVRVAKTEDLAKPVKGVLVGAEWPANLLRLAKGDKTPFAGDSLAGKTDEGDGSSDEGDDESPKLARFYRADQRRGYHGKWVDEGRADDKRVQPLDPMLGITPVDMGKGAAAGSRLTPTLSKEAMKALIRQRYGMMNDKYKKEASKWYYEAHNITEETAKKLGLSETAMAIAYAAQSPHALWGDETTPPGRVKMTNQVTSEKIARLADGGKDRIIDITPEMAYALNSPAKSAAYRINVEDYNGRDFTFEHGGNYMGKHKVSELPADIVINVLRPEIHAMSTTGVTALIGVRTGNPEVLGGSKVRSFYNNIRFPDNTDDVTIDTHMIRVLTGRMDIGMHDVGKWGRNPYVYKMMADSVREVAAEVGMKPHELQAALWAQQRDLYPADEMSASMRALARADKKRKAAEAAGK